MALSQGQGIVNTAKWLGSPVNIKEAKKQARIYAGRSLTPYIFCLFSLTMHDLHSHNAFIG